MGKQARSGVWGALFSGVLHTMYYFLLFTQQSGLFVQLAGQFIEGWTTNSFGVTHYYGVCGVVVLTLNCMGVCVNSARKINGVFT